MNLPRECKTNDQLNVFLRHWQQVLRLMDWTVTAEFVYPTNLARGGFGQVDWDDEHKAAYIRLLWPTMNAADTLLKYDPERVLVHELLHLHFVPFDAKRGPKSTAQEIAINMIAEAFVRTRRGSAA